MTLCSAYEWVMGRDRYAMDGVDDF
jgi:hypothetical protein